MVPKGMTMADYKDADEWFDNSQIEWGNGGGTESIRGSLKSTNGAVYRIEPLVENLPDEVRSHVIEILRAPEFDMPGINRRLSAIEKLLEELTKKES